MVVDTAVSRAVRDLPGCVGLSVWRVRDGVTSTVLALDDEVALDDDDLVDDDLTPYGPSDAAVLDAVQYVDGGPGPDVVGRTWIEASTPELLHQRWPVFAAAAGGRGVRGVVAVPVEVDRPESGPAVTSRLVGVVVLYLAKPLVVDGALLRLAQRVGAAALLDDDQAALLDGAGTTAAAARLTLLSLRTDLAARLLERESGLMPGPGRQRLADAARRAGIEEATLAEALIEVLDR